MLTQLTMLPRSSPFQIHDDSYVLRVMHAQQHLTDQARSAQAAQAAAAQTLQRAGAQQGLRSCAGSSCAGSSCGHANDAEP